jgi:hypothetical protein
LRSIIILPVASIQNLGTELLGQKQQINTARYDGGTTGLSTAGLAFQDGVTPGGSVTINELGMEQVGQKLGDVNTGRKCTSSLGTQTSAIIAGGEYTT